jgi:predicted DNA-binding protein (MmcQ/YjbR family)
MATFEDVRRIAMALPGAEEVLTWETDVTFRVGKKIFAIGGDGADSVSIKATIERQADLLALDSVTFAKSAYVGRFGWVTARLDRVDDALLLDLQTAAHTSVSRKGRRATSPLRSRVGVSSAAGQ